MFLDTLLLIRFFVKYRAFVFSKRRPGDVPSIVSDNSLAIKILNWSPKRDLAAMCKDGWKWYRKIKN